MNDWENSNGVLHTAAVMSASLPRHDSAMQSHRRKQEPLNATDFLPFRHAPQGFKKSTNVVRLQKNQPRWRLQPIHMLVIVLTLVTALAMSLTMLIQQSLTYQRMQHYQQAALNKTNIEQPARADETKDTSRQYDNKHVDKQRLLNAEEATIQESSSVRAQSTQPQDLHREKLQSSIRQSCIDLNRATLQELQSVSGVGPKMAQRIVNRRRLIGVFRRVEDLRQVKGIGVKTLAKLRDSLCSKES